MCGDIQLPFNLKKASAYDQNIGKIANSPKLVSREPTPLIQNHFFSFRTTPSHPEPPLLIQNHPFSFKTTPSHSESPLLIQNHFLSFNTASCTQEYCRQCVQHSAELFLCVVLYSRMYVQAMAEGCMYICMYTVRVTE